MFCFRCNNLAQNRLWITGKSKTEVTKSICLDPKSLCCILVFYYFQALPKCFLKPINMTTIQCSLSKSKLYNLSKLYKLYNLINLSFRLENSQKDFLKQSKVRPKLKLIFLCGTTYRALCLELKMELLQLIRMMI